MENTMQYVKFEYDTKYFGGNYSGTGAIAFIPKQLVDKVGYEEAFETELELDKSHIVHYDSDTVYDENHEAVPENGCKVHTINVVEMIHENICHIHAFKETPEGKKEAEELFVNLLKSQQQDYGEILNCLNEGYWRDNNGYCIQICYSI